MNVSFRVLAVTGWLLVLLQAEQGGSQQRSDAARTKSDVQADDSGQETHQAEDAEFRPEPEPVVMHWPDFWTDPDDEGDEEFEIKRATVQIREGAFTYSYGFKRTLGRGERAAPTSAIVFDLPTVLRDRLKNAFDPDSRPLCYAKSIHLHGGVGSNQRLGTLEIERRNGEVIVVGIDTYGFTLGEGNGDFDSTFFSGFLAELIDDACFGNSGQHLPEEWKEKLSGLTEVMDSKRHYRDLWAVQRADPAP